MYRCTLHPAYWGPENCFNLKLFSPVIMHCSKSKFREAKNLWLRSCCKVVDGRLRSRRELVRVIMIFSFCSLSITSLLVTRFIRHCNTATKQAYVSFKKGARFSARGPPRTVRGSFVPLCPPLSITPLDSLSTLILRRKTKSGLRGGDGMGCRPAGLRVRFRRPDPEAFTFCFCLHSPRF